MKNRILLLLLLCFIATITFAQLTPLHNDLLSGTTILEAKLDIPPPSASGTLTEALNEAFDFTVANSPIKGFNAAVQLPDGSIWKRAKGLAEGLPTTTPLTTEHLMGMGSITKSFLATTIMLLSEEGLLSVDDSIGTYLAPYPNVPGNVTIRQLLGHRSGINDYLSENPGLLASWEAAPDSIWALDDVLNNHVLAPNFPVGTAWSYSNTNYLLASRIIEKISGKQWYEVVREHIIDPLGLTHTFAYPWEMPDNQPFAHIWADIDNNGSVEDLQGIGIPMEGLFSLASGAGCLISMPEDLVKFSRQLYSGGLLQASSLEEMQIDMVQDPAVQATYGLGTGSVPFGGVENWGHPGDIIYKSFALYFPQLELSIAVQQNDDRLNEPNAPMADLYQVMLSLLTAYMEYSPMVATNEVATNGKLKLFPNPASQEVTVTLPDYAELNFPMAVEVTDLNGRVLRSLELRHKEGRISLNGLSNGLYFLRTASFIEKLIVNK